MRWHLCVVFAAGMAFAFTPAMADTGDVGSAGASPATLHVAAQDYSFDPSYPTVSVGTTIAWTNYDDELHTITSDDGLFDGEIQPGESFSFTFDHPGVYFYYCQPHDWMIGQITVTDAGS